MSATKIVRVTRYIRAGIAALIGVGFLIAGLFQAGAGRGSDVIWFLVIFFFCEFFAYRFYRRTREAAEAESFEEKIARRQEKLAEESASVVGKMCVECKQRVVVASEGLRCPTCKEPLHDDCQAGHERGAHGNQTGAYR